MDALESSTCHSSLAYCTNTGMWRGSYRGSRLPDFILSGCVCLDHTEVLDYAEGPPHGSWLRQVDSHLKDMGIKGPACAWTMT